MTRLAMTFTEAQKTEVETLAAVLNTEQIADFFGIARRTFYDMMTRDEDLAARYKKGRARAIGAIAQTLITKARAGDTIAMLFYLKTQGGWREADKDLRTLEAEPVQRIELHVRPAVSDVRVTQGSGP